MSLKNKFNISLFSIIIIFLVDRISKFYIITLSKKNFNQEILQSEYLNLVLIWNDGIAFGLLSLQESYLYNLITLLIGFIILVLVYLIYKSQNFKKFSYILVTGGALGNIFDRIVYKSVPDFIDFHFNGWSRSTSIFNLNVNGHFLRVGRLLSWGLCWNIQGLHEF